MFSINIHNETIYFKDINLNDLPQILEWYNKVDEFKFATGIDSPISLEELVKRYADIIISRSEIFTGIYLESGNKMIGILKGSLKYKDKDALWISSIVVDHEYQNKGYGSLAITLLLKYLRINNKVESAFLAVVEENVQGRAFWVKQKFRELKRIENRLKLQRKNQNIIIMSKNL
jgi:ribosomal protein S18 acetylase RimI-like enzyme